ncbi:MAG: 2-amino-4-hydroxy-6-hydroxymethyldihydropteridine diphosphokinase [Selenomonas bovis]|nr:2-amino-4-hydroxy-6-hydroxymethyldihydropteridine diphosphokinase [Selenomonas bovis]
MMGGDVCGRKDGAPPCEGAVWMCYLSLGANLGARAQTLREALRRLAQLPGTRLSRASSFYETAPWGKTDQPPFLNGAACLSTRLAPEALLAACQEIERALGRVRHEHWGARTLDIDLVYGVCGAAEVRAATPRLTLPHPYLLERAFVLVPLAEIAPELVLAGRPIAVWCEENGAQQVRRSAALAQPWPLRLIACIDRGRGLGRAGRLLYDLPEDLAHFRTLTQTRGSVLVMGRRTAESLPGGRPLAGRLHLVLSRQLTARERSAEGAAEEAPGRGMLTAASRCASQMSEETTLGVAASAAAPLGPREDVFHLLPDVPALRAALAALWRDEPRRPVWVIGGAAVYRALLPFVGEAYLTEVAAERPADAFLPELAGFSLAERRPAATPGVTFSLYRRKEGFFDGDFS